MLLRWKTNGATLFPWDRRRIFDAAIIDNDDVSIKFDRTHSSVTSHSISLAQVADKSFITSRRHSFSR